MAIWNFGSINVDHVYRVAHHVQPGETLTASDYRVGLGGKGANQSVAAARAGARCLHIGAVGADGTWARDALAAAGVDVRHIAVADAPTGHAIINVDPGAENSIVIYPGANRTLTAPLFDGAVAGDTLLLQNETSAQVEAAARGAALGLRVIYSAAPFQAEAVRAVLPHVSLLIMNAGEARALRAAMGEMPKVEMIVTHGADGAEWIGPSPLYIPAFGVEPVDTTGAGDCFAGTLAAALDAGDVPESAMLRASAAAAVQVTRAGAADAMPSIAEVEAFLSQLS